MPRWNILQAAQPVFCAVGSCAVIPYIIAAGIKEVEIRTVLTCNTVNGVCQKCYGRNLATGMLLKLVKLLVLWVLNQLVNLVLS